MHFKVGSFVKWEQIEGYIRFVCDQYISICVNIYDGDNHFDCCVLCYNTDWNKVTVYKEVTPIYPIKPCLRSSAG